MLLPRLPSRTAPVRRVESGGSGRRAHRAVADGQQSPVRRRGVRARHRHRRCGARAHRKHRHRREVALRTTTLRHGPDHHSSVFLTYRNRKSTNTHTQ